MQELKDRIQREGKVLPGNIVKVDGFLNHRVDCQFMMDKPLSFYAFEMLYWCGIREGELLALTPADFDFERGTVSISKSYQRLKGRDVITPPKTEKSNRTIQMPQFLGEEMQEYIKTLYGVEPTERMFPITKYYLHHEMDRGSKQAGVKRIRIHDIRHSAISLLIDMGFSAIAIADRVWLFEMISRHISGNYCMSMFTDPTHLHQDDPGHTEENPVFIYLDAFCRPEHFAEFLPEYQGLDELKAHYQRGGLGDVKVKKFLNDVMQSELAPIRQRRTEWEQRLPDVYDIMKQGSLAAERKAAETTDNVRSAMKINYF